MTLFWLVYTPLLLVSLAFFAWSLYRYVRGRWAGDEARMQKASVAAGLVTAEIIALEAQFIVAPRMARQEAIALLDQRGAAGSEPAPLPDDFASLLELVSRTRASLPTHPR